MLTFGALVYLDKRMDFSYAVEIKEWAAQKDAFSNIMKVNVD